MAQEVIPLTPLSRVLVKLEEGRRALAEARSLYEMKAIRDTAKVIEDYAKQQKLSREAVWDAAELRLWAERKMGEFLAQISREQGKGGGKKGASTSIHAGSKLEEAWSRPGDRQKWQRIASMPEVAFRDYLQRCRDRQEEPTQIGVLRLATVLADAQRNQGRKERGGVVESLEELVDQGKTFGTIYADPPWAYTNQGTRARTDRHYPTLSVAEIVTLPVQEVAGANSHLHLWTTNSFLPDALVVLEAWGFVYKSVFVWCKPHYGIGNYWRVAHEFLLLGVRGRCPFRDKGQRSWQEFPRTKHSKKPEEVRQLIKKASPGPYLELFGRKVVQDWTVVGNEVTS